MVFPFWTQKKKNTLPVQILLQNQSLTYFRGQTNYVSRFRAKLFRMKTFFFFLPKTPLKSFFQKTRFRTKFFCEIAPSPTFKAKWITWRVLGQNCSERKLCYFLPKMPQKSFFQKTCFWTKFFCEITLSPTFGAKRIMWRVLGQNCSEQKLCYFLPKLPPTSFFQKNSFQSKFFYEIAPTSTFGAKWTKWCVLGQNCSK